MEKEPLHLRYMRQQTEKKLQTLQKALNDARLDVIEIARTTPHVLPQWQVWQAAEDDLRLAKQRRDVAFKAWVKVRDGK